MATVNPERLTKFDRTQDELFRFLFFSVAVAGKTAKTIAIKVNAFFKGVSDARWHLGYLLGRRELVGALQAQKMGKYSVLSGFVNDFMFSNLDLTTCSVSDLEKLHGVGPKTARMFLLHSRPGQRFAVLDTHVLKFLKEIRPNLEVPKSTPSGKKYAELEKAWLDLMDNFERACVVSVTCSAGEITLRYLDDDTLDIAAFDLDLWRLYSKNEDDYAD